MRYTILYPRPELKKFVSHFWITSKDVQKGGMNRLHYSTACSLANIVFAFKGIESNPVPAFTHFQGQTSLPEQIHIPEEGFLKIFGISIYSYAIPQLFNALAPELINRSIPLSSLWGSQENILIEMMASSLATEKCISILSNYLQSQLRESRYTDELVIKATDQIRTVNGNINMERLSSELCLSQKQFTRRFKIQTGFNPKLYARIIRFESTLYTMMEYSSLTEAACMNGYYDQAHFIQDFKTFTGHNPNQFLTVSDLYK